MTVNFSPIAIVGLCLVSCVESNKGHLPVASGGLSKSHRRTQKGDKFLHDRYDLAMHGQR